MSVLNAISERLSVEIIWRQEEKKVKDRGKADGHRDREERSKKNCGYTKEESGFLLVERRRRRWLLHCPKRDQNQNRRAKPERQKKERETQRRSGRVRYFDMLDNTEVVETALSLGAVLLSPTSGLPLPGPVVNPLCCCSFLS